MGFMVNIYDYVVWWSMPPVNQHGYGTTCEFSSHFKKNQHFWWIDSLDMLTVPEDFPAMFDDIAKYLHMCLHFVET